MKVGVWGNRSHSLIQKQHELNRIQEGCLAQLKGRGKPLVNRETGCFRERCFRKTAGCLEAFIAFG